MVKSIPSNIQEIILEQSGDVLSRETIRRFDIGPEHFVSMNDIPAGTVVPERVLANMLRTPHIVMQSAAFAGVINTASENYHTKYFWATTPYKPAPDGIVYVPEAELNMRALAAMYRYQGHHVTVLPPHPGDIDGHYSTDSNKSFQAVKYVGSDRTGQSHWEFQKPVAISPNYTHESRQPEAVHKKRYLETTYLNPHASAHRILLQMKNKMEFGDTRIPFLRAAGSDRQYILAGIAMRETMDIAEGKLHEDVIGRSTLEGHREFEQYLQQHVDEHLTVQTVYLKQPFYHMDTTGVITQNFHFFTHRAAYGSSSDGTSDSWCMLQDLFGEKLVEVPFEDIDKRFGGNATSFGDQIYISDQVSLKTAQIMASMGYDVNLTPVQFTIASGGGHRCMTSVDYVCPDRPVDTGLAEQLLHKQRTGGGSIRRVTVDYQTEVLTLQALEHGTWVSIAELTHLATEYKGLYRLEMERVEGIR